MPKALSQNLESIAALQSFCIFGYQTEDPVAAVSEPGYFTSCAARLMANDLILVCADAAQSPAWGLFLVSGVSAEAVTLENVAGLTPDTVGGLTFLRAALPWPPSDKAKDKAKGDGKRRPAA